ncbi:MAG: PQQ-dependent sugar dehydrogenase [Gemmatales bacterium]|nr:PQQ-dependent sugar dehydrogenase [Gemmatales bacterium]
MKGSPEPPHPFKIALAYPKLRFRNPLLLTRAPGLPRWFVAEQAGRIYSFLDQPDVDQADLFLDLTRDVKSWSPTDNFKGVGAVYALTFHPRFQENRYCYICYVLETKDGKPHPHGTRVSRFLVTDLDPPRCDPKSETILLTWLSGGHNGADLHFGPDGYLYISTGDGTDPNPPDALDTGQDISDLLGAILRIDVDRPSKDKPYSIPPDNPFVDLAHARPEIWAYGFRNPWRMSFDRQTGDLWVGDVGWERWEMIYRVKKGGNYGWSVMEGPQPVRPESRRGPTPILSPQLALPHTEAASITGGYVYHGSKLPELRGAYICGDWVTGRLWACRFQEDQLVSYKEIARGPYRIVAFGESPDGELYFVHYAEQGSIHYLVPNPEPDTSKSFPKKLSETGIFESLNPIRPAPGVYPFAINAPMWMDTARAEYYVALPGHTSAVIYDRPILPKGAFFQKQLFFPQDGALVKNIALNIVQGTSTRNRWIETQILHFNGTDWLAYTYAWNDDQTDAELVPAEGLERTYLISYPPMDDKPISLRWRYASRSECLTCHNPWADFALAFTLPQLNRKHPSLSTANQLDVLSQLGLITIKAADSNMSSPRLPKSLVNPADGSLSLSERARSYLHVNCSHCHRFGAGGTADIDLQYSTPLERMKVVNIAPVQGSFAIPRPKIVAAGQPYHSVLLYRMAKAGPGHMPHLGSQLLDIEGLALIHDWIQSLPDSSNNSSTDRQKQAQEILRAWPRMNASEKQRILEAWFSQTDKALALLLSVIRSTNLEAIRQDIIAIAMKHPDPIIRELFESLVPPGHRPPRLGQSIRPEAILAIAGSAERGRELFFNNPSLQCSNCHQINGQGKSFGPDLSGIGKKYNRRQILESILEPSKFIEPPYTAWLLETRGGQTYVGLLVSRNDKEVCLKLANGMNLAVKSADIERLVPQPKSLMSELLLQDLSPQEAADLVEFLMSLRGTK